MLNILLEQKNSRIHYILEVLFGHFSQVDFRVFTDPEDFKKAEGFPLVYGVPGVSGFQVPNGGLLQIGQYQKPDVQLNQGTPLLYFDGRNLDWSFDLFSASFFLLSRMEEYHCTEYDVHGRFPMEQSLAFQQGFLHLPVIEMWLQDFLNALKIRFPAFSYQLPRYIFQPSFDIDQAWAFRHYPLWRQILSLPGDVKRRDWNVLALRLKNWLKILPDPYFQFKHIQSLHQDLDVQLIFFFLLGTYNRYNKNNPANHMAMGRLIRELKKNNAIGIHPGYYKRKNQPKGLLPPEKIKKEKQQLESILEKEVIQSRQHYLRFQLPETYETLIDLGIQEEYSMGYAQSPGFRAGCSRPFPWYNLRKEEKTSLMVYPTCLMDVSLNHYLKLKPETAKQKIEELVRSVKSVNGQFTSLWHNSSLSELNEWKHWSSVYQFLIDQAK